MNTNKKNIGTNVALIREVAEAKVGVEAAIRAGKCKNLKGVVHETIYKDMQVPKNLVNNCKTSFSKSPTAVRDDLITRNAANKIVERMQLKDTSASISKTISQVKNGHYKGSKLMGTKETVKAYENAVKNNPAITQKMTSTGVSSKDTARIATKTIGTQAGKLSASAVGRAAASSGAVGAAISGGVEVISSGIQ